MATITFGPAPLDFDGVRAGDRNLVTFSLTMNGTPFDLTGRTLTAQVRSKVNDDAVALVAHIDVTDAATGKGTILWDGEEVRTLLAGALKWTGVWDMQAVSDADPTDVITLCAGAFTAVLDVTRDT